MSRLDRYWRPFWITHASWNYNNITSGRCVPHEWKLCTTFVSRCSGTGNGFCPVNRGPSPNIMNFIYRRKFSLPVILVPNPIEVQPGPTGNHFHYQKGTHLPLVIIPTGMGNPEWSSITVESRRCFKQCLDGIWNWIANFCLDVV